jgi:hypothetical protein
LEDNALLLCAWQHWHRERLQAALAGPDGCMVAELVKLLRGLSWESASALLQFVRATPWHDVDHETRAVALHQINFAIIRLRERHGLPPFDDALPGDRLNVFQTIREMISRLSTSCGAAPERMPVEEPNIR